MRRRTRIGRLALLAGLLLAVSVPFPANDAFAQQAQQGEPTSDAVLPANEEPVLDLAACVRIAFERQPTLTAHRASMAAADVQYRGLDSLRMPTFIVRSLPVRRKQASLGMAIAEAGLTQAEWETVYAVTRTYYGALFARQQEKVVGGLEERLRFYQERVRAAVKGGSGSREWSDETVDKITIYLRLAETRHAEASRGVQRAIAGLREAMGVGPDPCVLRILGGPLPEPTVSVCRGEIIALAVGRRGEVAQSAVLAEITGLEADAQAKTCGPTAKTFASVVDLHSKPIPPGMANTDYRPGALGPDMPPLLAGPKWARVERAHDLGARADAVAAKTRNLIALEAEDAYLKWDEAAQKIAEARDAAEAGDRLSKKTMEAFLEGQRTRIEDILTSEALAAQARSTYNEALYQHLVALAGLQRVTAGGFDPGLVAVLPCHP
jgi:outer membrane protein TolC